MGLHGTYIMVMGQGKARLEFDDLVFVCRAAYVIDALQIQFLLYAYIPNHVYLHLTLHLRCFLPTLHLALACNFDVMMICCCIEDNHSLSSSDSCATL